MNVRTEISRNLEVIKGRFTSRLNEHFRILLGVFRSLDGGTAKPADVTEAKARAHKISGIAATFGYDQLGEQAAQVEVVSQHWLTTPLTPETTVALKRELARLLLLIDDAAKA